MLIHIQVIGSFVKCNISVVKRDVRVQEVTWLHLKAEKCCLQTMYYKTGRNQSTDIFTYCHLRCLHLIFEGSIDISFAAFDMPLSKIK